MRAAITVMMLAALAMLMIVPAEARVMEGSAYYVDAAAFDAALKGVDIYEDVEIDTRTGHANYVVYFDGDYYDVHSADDLEEVRNVALAAGYVSARTSWDSRGALAVYEDTLVAIKTADCRTLVRMCREEYSESAIWEFYLRHSYTSDRSDSTW